MSYAANVVTELYTKQGVRTSAIMGTLNMVHAVYVTLENMYRLPIKEGIFAWDKGHSQRRTELFPEYKSNRKRAWTPEDEQWKKEFYNQVDILHSNLKIFGVKSYRKLGWEGDDIIYGFTERIAKRYPDDVSVIISADEDFHQLISPRVNVYAPMKKVLYTPDNYRELMGMDIQNYLTYKILKGDKSDGIPGIQGIGDKTAKTLVNTFGGLDGILEHREELSKSKRTARICTPEGLAILDRNNKLINLKECVDISPILEDISNILDSVPSVDSSKAYEFLMQYQLTSIVVKYKEWSAIFQDAVENFQ